MLNDGPTQPTQFVALSAVADSYTSRGIGYPPVMAPRRGLFHVN
jgi:hypothetical protein